MPSVDRIKVVYITSRGHSGSTLLDLLISGHSEVVSVGEVKWLAIPGQAQRCGCRAPSVAACAFWRRVEERLRGSTGLCLADLDLLSGESGCFEAHNLALFEAVATETGRGVIVDSSKAVERLELLLECRAFDLEVVHLVRSPFGVVYSQIKKDRDLRRHARRYVGGLLRTRAVLRGRPHIDLRYEDLARRPERELAAVMNRLDLELEPGQLDFAAGERHTVGGNRMRFSDDSTIRLDEAWRLGLSARQKLEIALLTSPVRLPGGGLAYRAGRRLEGTGVRDAR